jgi:hypothetical protein
LKTLVAAMAALFLVAPASAQQVVGEIQIGGGNPFLMKKATDHVSRVKSALKQVLTRVEEARNEKDIVKLNCVNEKLAQIKQILNVAEGAEIALQEAVAKGDAGADAEYSKIAIARGKADQLRAEAEECIGQLAFVVDEKTSVEVQQPEDLPVAIKFAPETFGTLEESNATSEGGTLQEDYGAGINATGGIGGTVGTSGVGSSGGATAPPPPPPPVLRPAPASPYY